jgi:L-threonylcarbamoyladenylate synthase
MRGPPLDAAARALSAGSLVVFPTDTLLGLAARADDRRAVAALVRAKGRPAGQPLSIALSSTAELEELALLSPAARRWVRRHLPGPYTLLARPRDLARRRFAPEVAAGPSIGLRVPDHPVARELARRVGPIVATSANRHGEPPARTTGEARRSLGRLVRCYLPATPRPSGVPSTLLDVTGLRVTVRPRR